MFGIGWTEILLVGVVALLVLKPQDYPEAMRGLGRLINKARQMAGEFQGQFNDAMREANLDYVRKTIDEVRDLRNLSPVQKVTETLSRLADETRNIKNEIENTTTLLGDAPLTRVGTDATEHMLPMVEPAPAIDLTAFTEPTAVEPASAPKLMAEPQVATLTQPSQTAAEPTAKAS